MQVMQGTGEEVNHHTYYYNVRRCDDDVFMWWWCTDDPRLTIGLYLPDSHTAFIHGCVCRIVFFIMLIAFRPFNTHRCIDTVL